MSENVKEKESRKELGVRQLMMALLRRSWIIMLAGILFAVGTFLVTYYLITPEYQSSSMFYVNNSSIDLSNVGVGLSSGDISAAQELVESYIIILESRESLEMVRDSAGAECKSVKTRTISELRSMITASSVNSTEIFEVVVTSEDKKEALAIARAIEDILPKRIATIIEGTSAERVDRAVEATSPSAPSFLLNTMVGFLAGFMLSIAIIVMREILDVTIRAEEDIQRSCDHPVLAAVPDMTAHSKGGYYSRDRRRRPGGNEKETVLVGAGISFAASEAYKLLRTKLQFSFVDDKQCHILGVSSAMAGEGKSLSSVNLAYSLAQLEKRVLLVDCDMRRPSLNAKLPIQKTPGLSNYLTRQVKLEEMVQKFTSADVGFDVIAAGRNPPNPIELLSSKRMLELLEKLRGSYDYIVLDLPPVGEVSDALVAAKLVDGILLVVRQNYCDRRALSNAVEQFSFVDTRVLGVVLNCTTENGFHYKGYRYYKRYYSRYEGSYIRAAHRSAERSKEQE